MRPANTNHQFLPPRTVSSEQGQALSEIPDGTTVNDMLIWNGTRWILLDAPTADYQVLQRNADDTVSWSWVKAH